MPQGSNKLHWYHRKTCFQHQTVEVLMELGEEQLEEVACLPSSWWGNKSHAHEKAETETLVITTRGAISIPNKHQSQTECCLALAASGSGFGGTASAFHPCLGMAHQCTYIIHTEIKDAIHHMPRHSPPTRTYTTKRLVELSMYFCAQG